MAKKKKQEFFLNKYYKFLVIILAVACIALMFIPSLSLKLGNAEVSTINAWQAAFGAELTFSVFMTAKFNFSFLVLLIPILLVVGGIMPFIITRNLGTVISLGCFVTAAVLSFMLPVLAMPADATAAVYDIVLSVGGILVAVFSIIGAALGIVKLVV